MIQLDPKLKELFYKYKADLQRNDLDSFYYNLDVKENLGGEDTTRVTQFLEYKGIETIKYLKDSIPDCYCMEVDGSIYKFPKGLMQDSRLVIPDKITFIGSGAFINCDTITELDLNKVEEIEHYAFSGCESIEAVIFRGAEPPSMFYDIFDDCPALKKVMYPKAWPEQDLKVLQKTCFRYLKQEIEYIPYE